MKVLILSLFVLSIFALGINAQNCTKDSDCTTGTKNSCCYNGYFNQGSCYDNTTDVCTYCSCTGGCSALSNQLCSIATYGVDAQCCVDTCIDPHVNTCCSYHSPHSLSGDYSICPNSDTLQCCGAECQDNSTEQCCIYQTGDTQYYTAPKDRLCCGFYGTCDPTTQYCNGSSFNGFCLNKTDGSSPSTTSGASDNGCNDQACCSAQANPNPQTGTGYLQYVESCKQGGPSCVGSSGCQLCFNSASNAQNTDNRPVCNFGSAPSPSTSSASTTTGSSNNGQCNDQACCSAQATPNPQTGDGYLEYVASCQQGGQDCVGNSGCKLCFNGAAGTPNNTGRPACSFSSSR